MAKKEYKSLLKEAIMSEYDTTDTLDVKGPMLDPILSWNGNGELPIYKDAASILERYYFNEKSDKGVRTLEGETLESEFENDKGDAEGKSMDHAEGTGTEQAGTSDNDSMDSIKSDIKDALALEQEGVSDEDEKEEDEEDEEDEKEEEVKEGINLEMENAIIEKLIAEMEDANEEEDEEDEDVSESEIMTYTGEGPKFEAPDEKESTDPEEHTTGAGTEQAGTGDAEGEIPDREDLHDKMVEPKNYNEQIEAALAMLEQEMEDDKKKDDEDEDLDVDKEVTEEGMDSSGIKMGLGNKLKLATSGTPKPSSAAIKTPMQIKATREGAGPGFPYSTGDDQEKDEAYYAEALRLFEEEMEDDEKDDDNDKPENIDSDDVRV